VLQQISGKVNQCSQFSVAALGQTYQVSSKELQANTDAQLTFATVSTRSGENQSQLMQVSAAEGRLLVVATKSGTNLGDQDQKELENLINKVLQKAGGGTPSTTSASTTATTATSSPTGSSSPTTTGSETTGSSSPSPTPSP
jgi:hypothetical protein